MGARQEAQQGRGLGAKALGQSGPNSIPGVYNRTPTSLQKWNAALSRARNAQGPARIMWCGNSVGMGRYSGGTTNLGYTNARTKGPASKLSTLLRNAGLVVSDGAMFASGGMSAANMAFADARITLTSIAPDGSFPTMAGGALHATVAATTAFLPTQAFDTIEVFYINAGGSLMPFTIDVDGGAALATITPTNAGNVAKATVTCALGVHTVNVKPTTTGHHYLTMINTYDSASTQVCCWNAGWDGGKTSDWTTNVTTWGPTGSLGVYAADVMVLAGDINDWRITALDVNTYKSRMQTIITAQKAVGDVILLSDLPSASSDALIIDQQAFEAAKMQLALANNCAFIRSSDFWTSYAVSNAAPLSLMADTLHPNGAGYWKLPIPVARLLLDNY